MQRIFHPDIEPGTLCVGGLRKHGTQRTMCTNGPDGGPAEASAIREFDGGEVCTMHAAGASAIRPGGAQNDNGQVRMIYLMRCGEFYKVGLGQRPDRRRRSIERTLRLKSGERLDVDLLDAIAVPETSLGKAGPVSDMVESMIRFEFAVGVGGHLGCRLGVFGKEWVHSRSATEDTVRHAFARAHGAVLGQLPAGGPSSCDG